MRDESVRILGIQILKSLSAAQTDMETTSHLLLKCTLTDTKPSCLKTLDPIMNTFLLWLMWRKSHNLLEQIRLNQLTPLQRAAEAREEEIERRTRLTMVLIAVLIGFAFWGFDTLTQ
jgi:hypothetical protein